ncbi:hypothetical protein AVEN_35268-1 [Araneus ventricosus]|uniref:Uncharacterized protein n=1 Tax=Araneus ventricosus TaxID=182803 RepID=A0A4Y2EHQ6_ARAVE|nr:hypothetical protein AVEN_35268-1 [Araneus ventricosus]
MIERDVTIKNIFREGGFIRPKQEDEPEEKPADLSEEDYETWINIDSNLEKAEKTREETKCKAVINRRHTTTMTMKRDQKRKPLSI